MNIEEARLRAHALAMRTNARYREVMRQVREDRARQQIEERASRPKPGQLSNIPYHGLRARYALFGPRPRRALREELLEAYLAAEELRERLQEEIRPGVYAEWSDPLERIA